MGALTLRRQEILPLSMEITLRVPPTRLEKESLMLCSGLIVWRTPIWLKNAVIASCCSGRTSPATAVATGNRVCLAAAGGIGVYFGGGRSFSLESLAITQRRAGGDTIGLVSSAGVLVLLIYIYLLGQISLIVI